MRPVAGPRHRVLLLGRLAALFERIDTALKAVSCPGSGDCCQLARTGLEPNLFALEVALLEEALRAQGRAWPPARADGGCPLLDAAGRRCSVYADRPFGCRTYFCRRVRSANPYPNAAIEALNAALTRLSDELEEGASPMPMLAVAAARRGALGKSGVVKQAPPRTPGPCPTRGR